MPRKLVYSMQVSLDGFYEDAAGGFGWAAPDPEVHAFVNDRSRGTGVFLLGRRMFDTLHPYWPTAGHDPDDPPEIVDFAEIYRAASIVAVSRSLPDDAGADRVIRDDLVEQVRRLKAEDGGEINTGGGDLGNQLLAAGLVDEVELYHYPVVVGPGGKPALTTPCRLTLLETRHFASGVIHARYAVER